MLNAAAAMVACDAVRPVGRQAMTVAGILIACANTDELAYTGVAINQEGFATARLARGRFLCPACRQTHWWGRAEARLEKRVVAREVRW